MDTLRKNSMMNHLLDALGAGKDIGHDGRLVFTIVARHFMDQIQLVDWLMKDEHVDESKARGLAQQVGEAGYSPPNASTIRGYEEKQDVGILANPDDPDAGNVYADLSFPDDAYDSISEYHENKAQT